MFYKDCIRYYPFVLGAQPVYMIDLAAFYGGRRSRTIDSTEQNGRVVYEYPQVPLFPMISAADRASFYQLKTIPRAWRLYLSRRFLARESRPL